MKGSHVVLLLAAGAAALVFLAKRSQATSSPVRLAVGPAPRSSSSSSDLFDRLGGLYRDVNTAVGRQVSLESLT